MTVAHNLLWAEPALVIQTVICISVAPFRSVELARYTNLLATLNREPLTMMSGYPHWLHKAADLGALQLVWHFS